MPTTIEYANNPNEETAFVTPEGGQRTRTVLTTSVDGTVKFPDNPNSTKVSVTIDGVARKAVAVYNLNGGGDEHNLGYYATQSALEEAYPTAEAGDWAIVGSTDTVWVWDTDTSAWVDTDQKGQVTSVNNQTGDVTIGANDVLPSQTGYSGRVLGTDGFVAGWVEPEIVQRSTMPVASQDEEGNIYQFVGTTDATYTNGYFYECVSDGQNPATYSWTQTDVQPAPSGLPDQTGQSGKFLTTDGTDASWSDKPLVNVATGTGSLTLLGTATASANAVNIGSSTTTNGAKSVAIGYNAQISGAGNNANAVAIGSDTVSQGNSALALGAGAKSYGVNVAVGCLAQTSGNYSIALGPYAKTTVTKAVQINMGGDIVATNSDSNTMKVANTNGNFEIMSADGTIPTDRYTTTPSADGTYVPTLTISSGTATRTWGAAASAPVVPATAPTLAVNDWSSNTQSITVSGVTSSNVVLVGPAPSSAQDYADAGILCTAQGTDSLTFTCTTVPSNAITLSVVIFG